MNFQANWRKTMKPLLPIIQPYNHKDELWFTAVNEDFSLCFIGTPDDEWYAHVYSRDYKVRVADMIEQFNTWQLLAPGESSVRCDQSEVVSSNIVIVKHHLMNGYVEYYYDVEVDHSGRPYLTFKEKVRRLA